MPRSKFQVTGLMLLGLSLMSFLASCKSPTTTPSAATGTTAISQRQPQHPQPSGKRQQPPSIQPSVKPAIQAIVPKSLTQHPQPSGKQQQPPSKQPSVKPPIQAINPKSLTKGTHLVIKLGDRRVYVYKNQKLKVTYPIAIGKAGWETPIGNYKVMDKQRNPIWEEPWTGKVILDGPNNPLGLRWIGFWTDGRNSIGFHGTSAENLVGQAVSHGCIRMRNRDVVALYEQVKLGTPVTVKP